MRPYYLLIFIFVVSCAPTDHYHYQKHQGLTFDDIDWLNDEKLERPFLITSEVSHNCDVNTKRLYLPAKLFKNTEIEYVFFDGMKSETVDFVEGENPRYRVNFNLRNQKIEEIPFSLEPDQAVVGIDVLGRKKVIKIEDIRVPFYRKKGV